MSALVVKESFFGNGAAVVDAVVSSVAEIVGAESLAVVEAVDAPLVLPEDVSVLLISAPTHELSLPTPKTRKAAAAAGGTANIDRGVREWISELSPADGVWVVAIDTCTRAGAIVGSASKATVKAMKKRGFRDVTRGPSFYVGDTAGPLLEDQLEKAREFGRELATEIAAVV